MSIIEKRISTRQFKEVKVEKEQLILLAKAGLSAPSSKNKAPWEIMIVDEREILDRCSEMHENWKILKHTPAMIIVGGDFTKENREAQLLMTCSAATENILLRGVELDLGTVWLGAYPDQVRIDCLKKELHLPDNIVPISVIAVGYKVADKERAREVDTSKIHINGWRGL